MAEVYRTPLNHKKTYTRAELEGFRKRQIEDASAYYKGLAAARPVLHRKSSYASS